MGVSPLVRQVRNEIVNQLRTVKTYDSCLRRLTPTSATCQPAD